MGGSVGQALDPTSGKFLGTNNIPYVGPLIGRVAGDVSTGGLAEFGRKDPWYGLITNKNSGIASPILAATGQQGDGNSGVSGPFSIDPAQMAGDQAAITGAGQKQYGDTRDFISSDAASRAAARNQLADVLTNQAKDTFARTLPNIAESAQTAHLYDSSGYGQEVARQQAKLASDITSQVGQLGVSDIYNQSAQKAAALQGKQGFDTGALQRGLSLEDQINNANISKSIGQIFAPQPPSGKSQFGTAAQGVGALAPWANVIKGAGKGAAAGGAPGAAAGGALGLASDFAGGGIG